MKSLLHAAGVVLYRLLLALGIGGTVMFVLFAPVLFGVLPHEVDNGRHLAGQIVGKTLVFVQGWGIGAGVALALLGPALFWRRDRRWQKIARLAGPLLIAALSAVSMFVVAAEMDTLRQAMGVIDQVPLDDPRRVAFNGLHRVSSAVHLVILSSSVLLLALPMPYGRSAER